MSSQDPYRDSWTVSTNITSPFSSDTVLVSTTNGPVWYTPYTLTIKQKEEESTYNFLNSIKLDKSE